VAKNRKLTKAGMSLRDFALTYPDSVEEFPWDHRAIKVRRKIFLILADNDGLLRVTTKLPVSGTMALEMPFVERTGYGLGKSGWVTATFEPTSIVPIEMLREWIDESYRTVAPKKLVAKLDDVASLPKKPKRR